MLELMYIIIFIIIVINIFILKVINRTFFNPASIINVFWVLYIYIPLLVVGVDYANIYSIFYILSMLIIFSIPFYFTFGYSNKRSVVINEYRLKNLLIFITPLLLVLQFLLVLFESGLSVSLLIADPVSFANAYAGLGYSGKLNKSVFSSILLVFVYALPVFGGFYYSMSNNLRYAMFSLTPAALTVVLQGTKGIFLYSMSLLVAAIFSSIVINKFKINFFSLLRSVVLIFVLFFGLLAFAFFSRGLKDSNDIEYIKDSISESFIAYSSGHLYAFGDWFSDRYGAPSKLDYRSDDLSLGFLTFNGLYRFSDRKQNLPAGFYDEYYKPYGTWETNVYTVFRGLISDFGLYGSMLLSLFFGAIMKVVFIKMRDKFCVYSFSIYIVFVGFVYQSFVISSFSWLLNYIVPVIIAFTMHFLVKYEDNFKRFL